MKEEENVAFRTPVLFIQLFDSLPGQPQQRFVLRQRFFERVSKIGQQAEVEMVVPICQETDFQRIDQILDVLRACEHSRDYHQSTRFLRDPFGEVHSRQRMRRRQQRGQPVHHGHRQMACAQKRKNPGQREQPTMQPSAMRLPHQKSGEEHRNQQDRAAIQQQRKPAADFAKRIRGR